MYCKILILVSTTKMIGCQAKTMFITFKVRKILKTEFSILLENELSGVLESVDNLFHNPMSYWM